MITLFHLLSDFVLFFFFSAQSSCTNSTVLLKVAPCLHIQGPTVTNGDVQNGDSDCDGFELMTIDKIINGKVRQTENIFVAFFPFSAI